MHQISHPVPDGTRVCAPGHRPHLVESRGTPTGLALIGRDCPAQFHVECTRCGTATVPAFSKLKALRRWSSDTPTLHHIPLSDLGHVRQRVFDVLAAT